MSKVAINEITLTNIGNAIREKTGKTDLIAPGNMPAEIASISTGGGGIEVEPIVLTGRCEYGCAGKMSGSYIKLFGNTVSTNNITNASYMFYDNPIEEIPFDLNFGGNSIGMDYMFHVAKNLKSLPKMSKTIRVSNVDSMFRDCYRLRNIPEDIADDWNLLDLNSNSWKSISYVFQNCYSLRNIPENFLKKIYTSSTSGSSQIFNSSFEGCYVLDELKGLPVHTQKMTNNMFTYFLNDNYRRIKDITFSLNDDGSVKTANWKNQTILLDSYVGYSDSKTYMLRYNTGITADKEVSDDATYQALKDDPDWFTLDVAYSRYNHDSAVRTINSLPNTSAYLASDGGTNTIKFKGAAGSKTDGGAINTLTEEEIAVATAKGWTVTLV